MDTWNWSQLALVFSNILLLVSGLGMLFFGLLLVYGYHMTSLSFLDQTLFTFPVGIIALGVIIFIFSIIGIIGAAARQRFVLLAYAVIMFCLILPQFATTYGASQVKQITDEQEFLKPEFGKSLEDHITEALSNSDSETLNAWYLIQSDLRCCGSGELTKLHGYEFWYDVKKIKLGREATLPESCCVMFNGKKHDGCKTKTFFEDMKGRSSFGTKNKDDPQSPVYRTGCLTVLDHIYNQEPVYMFSSIFVGILELLSGVFAILFFKKLSKQK